LSAAGGAAPLLLVDAPHLLFRSYFALPKTIVDDKGRSVNALLGSVNMLVRMVAEHEPRAVMLCFGPDAAEYRLELYPAYHADREPVPGDLDHQFVVAPELFEAFRWFTDANDRLEADDLLGSYAATEAKTGGRALILTGDRDLFQCVTDRVQVLYVSPATRGPALIDEAEVEKRYGIPPALVPDFIALRGDPSDGLPGAKGIGAKTAAELLQRHGSLEGAIDGALRERSARVRGSLRDDAEQLKEFKEIATLRRIAVKRPRSRRTDFAAGARAALEFGMKRLAARLEESAP
jgi:5'-3' exonuclease